MGSLAELRAALAEVPDVRLLEDEPVARHGALRLGGEVEALLVVLDEAVLPEAFGALRRARLAPRPLAPLGDLYALDGGLSGALLRLGTRFAGVERCAEGLRVGAAAPLAQVGAVALREGLAAWACLRTWPGSAAAWLEQGPIEAFAPFLVSLRAWTGRGVRSLAGDAFRALPRSALPVELLLRTEPPEGAALPPRPPWPGEIFAADPEICKAFAESRLPGLRLRRIRLATEQVGVVCNLGGGSSQDLELVLRLVQDRLKRDHGLEIRPRLQPAGRPAGAPNPMKEGL